MSASIPQIPPEVGSVTTKISNPSFVVGTRSGPPIWKHLLWATVAVIGLWALSRIPSTMIVFMLAWLMAYLLNPAVDALMGRKLASLKPLSRGKAVAIVAALLLAIIGGGMALALPQLAEQIEKLVSLQHSLGDPADLPMLLREKTEPILARVPEQYREQIMASATNLLQESASKVGLWASEIVKSIGTFIGQIFSAIFLVCSAFLVSIYILMNWHGMMGDFLEKLPRQYQREVLSLSVKLNEIFGGYLKATILTGIACMIATFISLLLLTLISGHDFPYKGLVSFVAGIAYPVPIIGIIATSILGGVLGLVAESSIGFGIAVLVVINVVNIIIDRTVQPRLMSDAIGVSELFVMFAAFAGGEMGGVWGMLLGIPVAAMGKTLFEWFHLNFLRVDDDDLNQATPEPTKAAELASATDATKAPRACEPARVADSARPTAAAVSAAAKPAPSSSPPQTLDERSKRKLADDEAKAKRLAEIAEQLGVETFDTSSTLAVPIGPQKPQVADKQLDKNETLQIKPGDGSAESSSKKST